MFELLHLAKLVHDRLRAGLVIPRAGIANAATPTRVSATFGIHLVLEFS